MIIIDSQIHVWKAETAERPWSRPGEAHLAEPFTYDDLRREMKLAGVDRAVLVPPGFEGDRIDYVLEGAARHPNRFAVMGRISVEKPESIALLPGWTSQPGMRGIRLSFQKPHNKPWLTDGTADWFWPAAEKADIPVMVFAPGCHAELRAIAQAHPKLRLIVDHMALARQKDDQAIAAIERMIPLADCPNIYVKVSSVPFYSSEPYPYRNLHDVLRRLIAAFGPKRAFWGTDITRIWACCSYRQCVTLFTEELDFLSPEDLEWVMGRGLAECLKWSMATIGKSA